MRRIGLGSEDALHQQVVDYLKIQYPNVLFRTDFSAGVKMTVGQATRHKKLQACRAWPDLFVASPDHQRDYYGLFIELKKEDTKIFKLNGDFVAGHIKEQGQLLERLSKLGYRAEFGVGFDGTKSIIDEHLKGG